MRSSGCGDWVPYRTTPSTANEPRCGFAALQRWVRCRRQSRHAKDITQSTRLLRVLGCLPRQDGASGTCGRRPRSLRGGNRGREGLGLCRVLGLWGFERRGPLLVVWAARWQGKVCVVRLRRASTREQWSRCEHAALGRDLMPPGVPWPSPTVAGRLPAAGLRAL